MEILSILSALRRNGVGAILIGIQIALTLAIVCNSLSIVQQRLERTHRTTGLDEANIFTFANSWVAEPKDVASRIAQDLAALRSLPGVLDATSSNSYPLRGGGWSEGAKLQPTQKVPTSQTAYYFADDQTLKTYGLRLIAGRWFSADEIIPVGLQDQTFPKIAVVTQQLANRLFPAGDALGKVFYLSDKSSTRIIGVVDQAATPWTASTFAEEIKGASTFVPFIFANNGIYYIVRTEPGMQAQVMHSAEKALLDLDRNRVIQYMRTFGETRARAYRTDRALGLILMTVCALLLIVTAFGIVGLTTYWVAQRRRQIGVRRALGARRVDILRYFQTENLLIAGGGTAVGVGLALAGNLWLVTHVEMITRLSLGYVVAGAAIVLALSQAAVIWPAARAAALPPAMATRNV
jgi:putative ABC transport system permease protein